MTTPWQSTPIAYDGIELQVQADADGVTFGKTVDGVYASDLLMPSVIARKAAYALLEAADYSEKMA